jgi:hypothetical protein
VVAAALTLAGVLSQADAFGSSPAGSGQNGTGGVTGPYAPGTSGEAPRAVATRAEATEQPSPHDLAGLTDLHDGGDQRETSWELEWGPPRMSLSILQDRQAAGEAVQEASGQSTIIAYLNPRNPWSPG